jgi:hypothetical protein
MTHDTANIILRRYRFGDAWCIVGRPVDDGDVSAGWLVSLCYLLVPPPWKPVPQGGRGAQQRSLAVGPCEPSLTLGTLLADRLADALRWSLLLWTLTRFLFHSSPSSPGHRWEESCSPVWKDSTYSVPARDDDAPARDINLPHHDCDSR